MVWILLMVWACDKPKPISPPEPPTAKIDSNWVWRTPITEAGEVSSHHPFIYDDKVVYSTSGIETEHQILLALGTEDGLKKWAWSDYEEYSVYLTRGNRHIVNNLFIYKAGNELGAVNLSSGQTEWSFIDPNRRLNPRINLIDENVYLTFNRNFGTTDEKVYLSRTSALKLNLDTITSISYEDGYKPSIEGPSLWMNAYNDSVLIFQNRTYSSSAQNGYDQKVHLHGYNLATDSTEFIIDDLTPYGGSNVFPPIIDGDMCYFLGERAVLGVNLSTRKIIWEKEFRDEGGHLWMSNMLLVNGNLIIKQDNEFIHALDPATGSTVWSTSTGGTPSYMREHNGTIYFTSDADGKLYAVNASTGQVEFALESPDNEDFFANGVAIDETTGLIYTMDHFYAYCFDPDDFR